MVRLPSYSIPTPFTKYFPPKPEFTEKQLPDLKGKVYIVSGSNTGVGKELARLLYSRNAKVYIAARSEEKSHNAIEDIKQAAPNSTGALVFLKLDLADLSTIKATVNEVLAAETKLHVLFNNAGVLSSDDNPPKTAQGYELHLGVNNVGTFLFTKLLTPLLVSTARAEPPNTVRVVWVASSATEMFGQPSVGWSLDTLDLPADVEAVYKYSMSKVGNWLHGVEFARRHRADGVVSVPLNPGNLTSELYRQQSFKFRLILFFVGYPPLNGAYTELFAGLSPAVTLEKSGNWVGPFGRFLDMRADMLPAAKTVAEGGSGGAFDFWEWTEEQVKKYL